MTYTVLIKKLQQKIVKAPDKSISNWHRIQNYQPDLKIRGPASLMLLLFLLL